MNFVLTKRPKVRSGIPRGHRREWPRHRRFVRRHVCVLDGRPGHTCIGQIECCHLRLGTDGHMEAKPSDWWTWAGCSGAHREQHNLGEASFQAKWCINLYSMCLTYAKASPDFEMKKLMKEMGVV